MRLVKEYDPMGDRTMGVLTKVRFAGRLGAHDAAG